MSNGSGANVHATAGYLSDLRVSSGDQAIFRRDRWSAFIALALVVASPLTAHAVDEIQVYNGEIAKVGEWTVQQHLNYAINGLKEPDFPGAMIRHHALNGTPEFAYGLTPWWEFGFYVPWAVDKDGHFHSDAGKIRSLFVTPEAEKREFFYGVNFEFAYSTGVFSETRWNSEIRPIIGWRKGDYEFIVNPIVDVAFGRKGGSNVCAGGALGQDPLEGFSGRYRILHRSRPFAAYPSV